MLNYVAKWLLGITLFLHAAYFLGSSDNAWIIGVGYFGMVLSCFITWAVILGPPIILRVLVQKNLWLDESGDLPKFVAVSFAVVFFIINFVVFSALQSTSVIHGSLLLGAYLTYQILTKKFHSKNSDGLKSPSG